MNLPSFPTDPATLDLLEAAILHPGAQASNVGRFLEFMSQLAGADIVAVDEPADPLEHRDVTVMRDPQYSEHDVILALIAEIRRVPRG